MDLVEDGRQNWIRRRQHRLVDVFDERLLAAIVAGAQTPRTPVWSRLTAAALALPVHLVTAGMTIIGCWWLVTGPAMFRILGVILLLTAAATCPRWQGRPQHVAAYRREDAPALFGVIERIATVVDAPMPDEVLIESGFNAAALRTTSRRRMMVLGASLWVAAPQSARVALIAHELGHFAHGDLRSTAWVGAADESLQRWHDLGRVDEWRDQRRLEDYRQFWTVIASVGLMPLRTVASGYLAVLVHVNAAATRRQECLADLAAIRAAGHPAVVSLMDTLLSQGVVAAAITRSAVRSDRPDPWLLASADLAALSDADRLRQRGTATAERSRLDHSHPRTTLRLRLAERLAAAVVQGPLVTTVEPEWARIDEELAEGLRAAAVEATDLAREALMVSPPVWS